jgi:mRNA-degrading endonuclease RelE of RelBE toxin-antitoxin system
MNIEIRYSENALKQLKRIAKGDPKSARMIIDRIEKYSKDPGGYHDIKILKGNMGEMKRLRCGNY